MSPTALLIVYATLIAIASLVGGWIPLAVRLSDARMEIAVSFVAGLMIGLGLLDLLPHAMVARALHAEGPVAESLPPIGMWMLAGVVFMFLVERVFCYHDHGGIGESVSVRVDSDTGEVHHEHGHTLTWVGAAVGLTIHSVLAGIALAAVVSGADAREDVAMMAGLGTFLMIVAHKPFDALSIATLMATGGSPWRLRHLVNVVFALATPAGMLLFIGGLSHEMVDRSHFVSNAIAFAAGMFVCVALSDLLPELRFHERGSRRRLAIGLLLGLVLAWGISRLHDHGDAHGAGDEHDHEHAALIAAPASTAVLDPSLAADILDPTMNHGIGIISIGTG